MRLIVTVLVLLMAGSGLDCLAESGDPTEYQGSATLLMPYGPAEARTQLRARLANLAHPALRQRYRLIIEYGTPLFPPDEQIAVDAARRGAMGDDLTRWLHLGPGQRRFDLLLLPDVDYFWPAALQPGASPVLYSAAFILHIEPATNRKTRVQVFQINCMARFGKKFDLLGRTGPKWYWDDRPVPPAPQAAAELIDQLTRAAGESR